MPELLIYGAYGYTGALIAREAVACGLRPVLAGRNAEALQALARELGLEHRAFSLDDPAALDAGIQCMRGVLHCAGPFAHTFRPVVDACLRAGAHYLDITGEVAVFESLAACDTEAKAAGVMLLPGAGFDVVPSDCLAAHLKRRLPSATHLALGILGLGRVSRGTARTMAENLHRGGLVRRGGVLPRVPVEGHRRVEVRSAELSVQRRGHSPAWGIAAGGTLPRPPWADERGVSAPQLTEPTEATPGAPVGEAQRHQPLLRQHWDTGALQPTG